MSRAVAAPESQGRAHSLARGGALSFVGAGFGAVLGLLLTVQLTRTLGESGSGVVLQVIGTFTIALSIVKLGMDSSSIWLLPRLSRRDPSQVGGAVITMLTPGLVLGLVAAGAAQLLPEDAFGPGSGDLVRAVQLAAWFLPVAAVMWVALAAGRALGGVLPYVLVWNLGVPGLRPLTVWAAVALGAGAVGAAVAWAVPFVLALVCAVMVLRRRIPHRRGAPRRPDRALVSSIYRFALPRTASAGVEQSMVWLDVLLVGVIAGPASAGIYGAASRLVVAGFIVDTALRVVVAPRMSGLLHDGKTRAAETLCSLNASWLTLLSVPVYVLLGVFAPTVLALFGPGFTDGATALRIVCAGGMVAMAGGAFQTVLLMSGHSGWAAINKGSVLVVSVVGNLLLIPVWGITAAAAVWAAGMLLDAGLAVVQAKHLAGVHPDLRGIGRVLVIAVAAAGVPSLLARWWWGDSVTAVAAAALTAGAVYLCWLFLDRERLHLTSLRGVIRSRA